MEQNKLPDFIRNKILQEVIEPTVQAMTAPAKRQPIKQPVGPSASIPEFKTDESKVFEHRKHLKEIRSYCKVIKKDDVDWTDNDWNGFEKWIEGKNKKVADMSMEEVIEGVFKSKLQDSGEGEEQKSKIRKQILEKGFGDFSDKLKKFNF